MKILFLSQFFTPEPDFKGLPFARELVARGHRVEVLTGFPNYPGGKVYPNYRIRFFQRETMHGVRVNRVPLYPSHDTSAIGRVLNYSSFALSASTIGPFLVGRPDVAYVYHPPPTNGLPAGILKLLKGVPFVYDIQDMWPDSVAATGMMSNQAVLKAIGVWCRFVYRRADRITVLSPGFRKLLIARGVPEEKVSVIYNWCDEQAARPVAKDAALAESLGMAGGFNIVFAGTMGKAQQLDAVLDAAQLCAAENPRIRFVFVGGGIDRQRLEARALPMTNVLFLPYRPASEMPALLALADAMLVHLRNDPLFEITVPSKTQACMAAGKPILMAAAGDAADIVRAAGAGVFATPGNARQIADAALRMAALEPQQLAQMGAAGRDYYFRNMSFENGVTQFEKLFQSCIPS